MKAVRYVATGQVQCVEDETAYAAPDWEVIGDIPDGADPHYIIVVGGAAEVDLATLRTNRWDALKAEREIRLATATTAWGVFQSDPVSQGYITGKVTKLNLIGDTTPSVTWRLADNSMVTLSKADFIAAAEAVADHIEAVMGESWALEAALDAATTAAEIEAVTWSGG